MIKKFADHFNPANNEQISQAKKNFTPSEHSSLVKKFHPASTSTNQQFTNEAKRVPTSGVPKTKWWSKIQKAQLN